MRTRYHSSSSRYILGLALSACCLLQINSASAQTPAPTPAPAGTTNPVTGTSDWDQWKRNCSGLLHHFKQDLIGCGSSTFRSRPFHFVAQSIVPGSGVGGGGQYAPDLNAGKWQNQLKATSVITIRQFWLAELKFQGQRSIDKDWNKSGESLGLNIYVHNRSLPVMTFYGLGPNTNVNNSVKFSQRDTVAGIDLSSPTPVSWLSVGGKLEGLWPNVGGVTGTNVISIQQQYTEQTAPGLTAQPPMVHEQIFLHPHKRVFEQFAIDYNIAYNFYQDTDTGHFSFRRFEANLEHHFYPEKSKLGVARLDRDFIVRWRYSASDASSGNAVPFYLQQTLGGTDIDNQPTLRAFKDYRFRGPDLMMVQAEYDRRVWKYLGILVSYDAGKVALRKSDLNFSGMHQSFGGGVAIYLADKLVFRMAVALGGGEGAHPYFGIANFL
jgi:hypothetical protein